MKLNENTTIRDLYQDQELRAMRGNYISSVNDRWIQSAMSCSLRQIHEQHPTWGLDDMLYGLRRLERASRAGHPLVFSLYSEEEIAASPDKAQAQMLYLPPLEEQPGRYALLLAGGGFGAVCTLPESLPMAARLNELGYSCFCLNYRTASDESFIHGLLPKPMEDIAAALRLIRENAGRFGLDRDRYLLSGFSAGGFLAALWGTEHLGARAYGLPQPELLLLDYPLASTRNLPSGPLADYIKTGMYGAGYAEAEEDRYAVDRHIDGAYPPVYLAAARDDDTVPPKDQDDLRAALKNADIAHRFEIAEHGGHGFGLGSDTELAGWVDRALAWMEERYGA